MPAVRVSAFPQSHRGDCDECGRNAIWFIGWINYWVEVTVMSNGPDGGSTRGLSSREKWSCSYIAVPYVCMAPRRWAALLDQRHGVWPCRVYLHRPPARRHAYRRVDRRGNGWDVQLAQRILRRRLVGGAVVATSRAASSPFTFAASDCWTPTTVPASKCRPLTARGSDTGATLSAQRRGCSAIA